jgi:hypothetical protein
MTCLVTSAADITTYPWLLAYMVPLVGSGGHCRSIRHCNSWRLIIFIDRKKLSSFIRSCIGDVIYDRYEIAKIK